MNTRDFIDTYMKETEEIARNVDRKDIEKFIDILFDAWKNGNKIITMGNGGSSSTASHFAGDLLKTVANDSSMKEIRAVRGFKAICLNDNSPALTAWINDSGWDNAYSGLLNTLLDKNDVILLVSVHGGSGWSGNMVKAMQLAKERGAKIVGLAGFDGGKMKEMCDVCIVVPKDSTPHTEGFHGVLQHLVVFRLKGMIDDYISKKGMSFFADTANHEEIDYCFSNSVDDGITTNPKIMETTGNLSLGFEGACREIVEKYPNVPVSLETDLRGISVNEVDSKPGEVQRVLLEQAEKLIKLGKNVVIKIPICEGGLRATRELNARGIKTNVTACMTPYQALEAAKAGATYVSLFANRMLDAHILEMSGYSLNEIKTDNKWKEIVTKNKSLFFEKAWEKTLNEIAYVASSLEGTNSSLIVGSIRTPEDILRIVKAEPQIITIPTKIVKGLSDIRSIKRTKRSINTKLSSSEIGNSLNHPMTTYTLDEFEKAADSYRK